MAQLKDSLITGDLRVTGTIYGNATSANKLSTSRTISLTGAVTGSGSFDGSGNLSITTTKNHTHPVGEITWAGGQNLTPTASANGQEWSIDLNSGSYTDTYFHIWSTKNSKSILCCYPDDNRVTIPNGTLTVNGNITGNAGLEIKGHIAGDTGSSGHGLWSGGGYHNAYNNIILHGDASTGTSGIAFVSDKGSTTINQPSDRAFIQWHAHGVTTYTAESTNPTLATSGEANILVIGVGNDATDQIRLQSPAVNGLLHQVGASAYVIPSLNETTTTANHPLISTATAGLYTNNTSITMNGGTITATTFNGNASTATKLQTARTISLTGSVTGSGTFDGSGNLSITTTTNHTHSYLPLAGGTMTGQIQKLHNGQSWVNGRKGALIRNTSATFTNNEYNPLWSVKSIDGTWDCGTYTANNSLYFSYITDTNYNAGTNATTAQIEFRGSDNSIRANKVYGAVWNDYAEYRKTDNINPGHCVIEKGDDTLTLSTNRLQPGAEIVSDTFGFAIGETDECKTPIAVSGRVLAYPYENREEFKKNIGCPVCSGPNGTVSIMSDEEYKEKGYLAIGTISAVPDYEEWGMGKIKVNGRVWIRIK